MIFPLLGPHGSDNTIWQMAKEQISTTSEVAVEWGFGAFPEGWLMAVPWPPLLLSNHFLLFGKNTNKINRLWKTIENYLEMTILSS